MKNQKKKEKRIDNKDTFDTPPDLYAPVADTPNASAQFSGSIDSYLPYSLINRNKCCRIAPNTKKTWPATLMPPTLMPPMILVVMLLMPPIMMMIMLIILNQFTFPCAITIAIAITISKSPPTPTIIIKRTWPPTLISPTFWWPRWWWWLFYLSLLRAHWKKQ